MEAHSQFGIPNYRLDHCPYCIGLKGKFYQPCHAWRIIPVRFIVTDQPPKKGFNKKYTTMGSQTEHFLDSVISIMENFTFNNDQEKIIQAPIEGSIFLFGASGTGKTTTALGRLGKLLHHYPGYKTLIICPQQSLANPYRQFVFENTSHAGSFPTITTVSGISQDLIKIFWPLISGEVGFKSPEKLPNFLSLETAQYCLSKIVDPLLEKGYFQSVTIERNRLFSQILDNLNKTALVGISIDEIALRLKSTSNNTNSLHVAFDQVQECAKLFREYCLNNNLIDFSLLVSSFRNYLWPLKSCRDYLYTRYDALIADNLEEDTPFAHELIKEWTKSIQSSLLIYDEGGGYRSFLGADPEGAYRLKEECQTTCYFKHEFTISEELKSFRLGLKACIQKEKNNSIRYEIPHKSELTLYTFYPEMISETCEKVRNLIDKGIQPRDIAILSPYLSDSLKFSMTEKLKFLGVATATSRPSRMYINAPEIKALLIFAKLSHPSWKIPISFFEFRHSIMQFIPNLDVIRADLITKTLFSKSGHECPIRSFDAINNIQLKERITFQFGEKIEALRNWLIEYLKNEPKPLDIFFQNLYGQLLSQDGFQFHSDFYAAHIIAKLIQSLRSFRLFSQEVFEYEFPLIGKEYIQSVEQGLIPAAFNNILTDENAVLIAPAYTFLMRNQSVAFQFWLDIGSLGWWERLYQPLTNPYVFRKNWVSGASWTEQEEYENNQKVMGRLVNGLLNRCTTGVIAAGVQINEYGSNNHGPLLQAIQLYKKRNLHFRREDSV